MSEIGRAKKNAGPGLICIVDLDRRSAVVVKSLQNPVKCRLQPARKSGPGENWFRKVQSLPANVTVFVWLGGEKKHRIDTSFGRVFIFFRSFRVDHCLFLKSVPFRTAVLLWGQIT